MLNFNQLRIFYFAAKHLSFTEAARRLFITQPAVTAQIKHLEEHCNLKLFRKRGRRVCLTEPGEALFEYVKRVFEYEREIEDAIEELRELKRGALKIGTTKTYARYFMPLLITAFHEAHPGIRIHLDEGSSLDMIRSLLELRNEVAVIAQAGGDHPDVLFTPFSHEEMVVILAPGDPLARRRRLSPAEVAARPIIMKEAGSGTRKVVNELFEKADLAPEVLMETSNTEFIKQLVMRGEGVSILVREAVAQELREGKLASAAIKGPEIFLDVSIAHLRDQHFSPPARAFLDILARLKPAGSSNVGIGALMARILAGNRRTA